MAKNNSKLLQRLIVQGIINDAQKADIENVAKTSKKTEEEIILERGLISEESLFELKSEISKTPFKKINVEEVPLSTLEIIPAETSATYKMVPLAKKKDVLEVGMLYPENVASQDALRFLSRQQKLRCKIFLITISQFNALLKQHRTLKRETEKALAELEQEKGEAREVAGAKMPIPAITEEAPIIKIVLNILKHAIEGKASDIHIEPGKDTLRVRFRLDGILYSSLFLPLNVHESVVARVKILSNLKIDETRIPQDGRFSLNIDNKDIDFRVSTFPTLFGEKVEMRVLDPSEGLKPYEELGLKGRNFEIIKKAIARPYGLILATGPTGCGKTTTLYAILRILNKEGVNIVTIEDPIEYSIEGVNQSQINPEIKYTFARGLRHILRQDPDIIMVGENRDEETASLVTHAALTGHIVLSSLHTNSAIGAIPRLIDMKVRPFLIPSTLSVAISQRLVRTLCPYCKKKKAPDEKVRQYILEKIKGLPPLVKKQTKIPSPLSIFEPVGCEKCNFKGFTGRIGLFEVLDVTPELSEVILKRPVESAILEVAQKQGMLTMEQEGILKALDGETSIEEVVRATEEK